MRNEDDLRAIVYGLDLLEVPTKRDSMADA